MKTRLLIIILFVFSVIVVIPATAQEYDCVEIDIEIESTKNLDWTTCYLEEYASLLIKTSSEEPTDNKIILQKDTFWNYDVDCSPTPFFTLINGEEIDPQEEYFDDYRTLSIPLEKGENEIEIIIATIPGLSANEYCLTEPVEPIQNLSEGIVDCVEGYFFNGESCVPEPDCGPNTLLTDGLCVVIDGGCEPDINGNTTWCGPQYDYLKIILSEPYAFLFVFGTPSLIAGIIIGVIVWRKRK